MDKWDYFKHRPQDFFFLFYTLISIYFFEYETIVRNSAWSFGHSDPNSSSVSRAIEKMIEVLIEAKLFSSQLSAHVKITILHMNTFLSNK